MIGSHFQNYMSNFPNTGQNTIAVSQPAPQTADHSSKKRKQFQLAEQLVKAYQPKQKANKNQDVSSLIKSNILDYFKQMNQPNRKVIQSVDLTNDSNNNQQAQFFNRRNNKNKATMSIDGPIQGISKLPQNIQQNYMQVQNDQQQQMPKTKQGGTTRSVLDRNKTFYQDMLNNQQTNLAGKIKSKLNNQLLKRYQDQVSQQSRRSVNLPQQTRFSESMDAQNFLNNDDKQVTMTASELVKLLGQAQNGQMQQFLGNQDEINHSSVRDTMSAERIEVLSNDMVNLGDPVPQQAKSTRDPFSIYGNKNAIFKKAVNRVGISKRLQQNNRMVNRRKQLQFNQTLQADKVGGRVLSEGYDNTEQAKQQSQISKYATIDNEKNVQSFMNSLQTSTRSGNNKSVNFSTINNDVKDRNQQKNANNQIPFGGFQNITQNNTTQNRFMKQNGQSTIQDQIIENEQSTSDSGQQNRTFEPNVKSGEMIPNQQENILDDRPQNVSRNSRNQYKSQNQTGDLKVISQKIRQQLLQNQLVDDLDENEILQTIANLVQSKKQANEESRKRAQEQSTPQEQKNQIVESPNDNSDVATHVGHSQRSKLIDQRKIAQTSYISKNEFGNKAESAHKTTNNDGTDSNIERMKVAQFTSRNDEQEVNRQSPFDQEQIRQLQEKIHKDVDEGVANLYHKSNTQNMKKNPNLSSETKKYDDAQMNLYDKSIVGKSIKQQRPQPDNQQESNSFLPDGMVVQEDSFQEDIVSSSGLGSFAQNSRAPPQVVIDKALVKDKPRNDKYDRRKSLFVGRKSNSQNQIRNEQLQEEIKTNFPNEQIFQINPDVFNDYSPETADQPNNSKGPNSKRPTKISFESDLPRFLKCQIDRQVDLLVSTSDPDISQNQQPSYLKFTDYKINPFGAEFKENMSIYDNGSLFDQGLPTLMNQRKLCNQESNHKADNIIKQKHQQFQNEQLEQKQQLQTNTKIKSGTKQKEIESSLINIEEAIDFDEPFFDNQQCKKGQNAIFVQMKREMKHIQDHRTQIVSSIKDKIAMDLIVSSEIDQQLMSHQNLEEMSKFFLNTKVGNHVRKIPNLELSQVDLQEEILAQKNFYELPQTSPKSNDYSKQYTPKAEINSTAKFNKINLASIIEQKEQKRASKIAKSDDPTSDFSKSHHYTSQIQRILDSTNQEQYNKVIQVLKLRQSCLSVNKNLHLLRANDKLLKKKVQFYEFGFTYPSTHSSIHQSDAQEQTVGINDRSVRSQSTKMQNSIAPSFQDSQFKQILPILRLGDPITYGNTLQKKPNKKQLYKHGTVEIMYDPKNTVNANQFEGLQTGKKEPEMSDHLNIGKKRSNGQMTHNPGSSEDQKNSDGYLNPGTNIGASTIDKVQTAQTPYFKLQTPSKLLTKSNMTFNSQQKINQSAMSLSNGHENQRVKSPISDKLSNDSSEQSALMNAKNIGLDGELLNNRRTFRSQSLVQEFQQRKMKQMSLNKILMKGTLFSKLRDKFGTKSQPQTTGQMDKIMDDISQTTLIIISRDELNQRETEMLLVHRLSIYFNKNNAKMQSQFQKQFSQFHKMITKKKSSIKFKSSKTQINPAFEMLFQDYNYPQQEKELNKIIKKMRKKCHFFQNSSLIVRDFEELNIVELSNQVDGCEIEMKVTMESYIKDFGEKNKTKKLRAVQPKKLAEENLYFENILKQIQEQRLQIELFPNILTNHKIFVPLKMRTKNDRKSLFKLQYLVSKITYCKLDYDTWLNNRLRSVTKCQKIQADYLFNCQLDIFMNEDGQLLRSFLNLDHEEPKLKLDSDYDDSSLLSDQVLSIYSSSMLSAENKSVNSSCDNLSFNNIHNINVVHNDFNPMSILGKVIIRKNANWEIFKLLSQSKNDKIKNKIKFNENEKSNLRELLIEQRIKTIRKNAAEAIEFGISHQNMFKVASEESSDLDSNLSLKQTSTYMYVERIQEFLNVDMDPDASSNPKRKMLTKEIPMDNKQNIDQQMKDQKFLNNVEVDRIYGFRYNQMDLDADDESQSSPLIRSDTLRQLYLGKKEGLKKGKNKRKQKKKGYGMIKLLNGMPLSLDDEKVNLHCDLLTGRPQQRALEHQKLVQVHYDKIRISLRDIQYNENKIIKYRRSFCMNEIELDADHGQYLRKLQEMKLQKYTKIREKQSAFATDVTKFFDKKYAVPFRDYYIRKFDHRYVDPNEIARFKKARESHAKNPWIGFKGQEFVLSYKLQSHGSFMQLKELREEFQTVESLDDINSYKKSVADDKFPIYMMFEVIHVYRIQECDKRERRNIIACKLAMALKRKREMEAEIEERALALALSKNNKTPVSMRMNSGFRQ